MVYYILVGIFSSNLLYHKKDCFPTLLRVVAVFFYCAFFYSAFFLRIKKGTGEVFLCLDLFDKTANFHVGAGALDNPILRV